MKRFALLLVFSLLSVAACQPDRAPPVVSAATQDVSALQMRAEGGDTNAMIQLGEHYCANEPKEAKGALTLKWWTEAAKAGGTLFDARPVRHLGRFYLNLYSDEYLYDPEKSVPQAYCTAGEAGKMDAKQGVEWLAKCANESWDGSCNIGLGHFYYYRQKYDKAYFWYATALAEEVVLDGYKTNNRRHPANDILPLDPTFYEPYNIHLVSLAAKHLDGETASRLNRRALAWYKKRTKRNDATAEEIRGEETPRMNP